MSGSFLLGLPGKIGTLLTRLSAARAGYLDNLSAGAVAQAGTALSTGQWTNARAGYLDALNTGVTVASPLLADVKANGMMEGSDSPAGLATLDASMSGLTADSTVSTTFVDAVNYTGAGVLLFAAAQKSTQNVTIEVLIDGTQIVSATLTAGSGTCAVAVGALCGPTGTPVVVFEPIQFRTSLQIRHKTASAAAPSICYHRYRKTA